jgi:signal transduction histidine kinase
LWLNTRCGLVRIARTDLDAVAANRKPSVTSTVFDASDGMRVQGDFASGFSRTVGKSKDGRLWFVVPAGVAMVDPRRLPVNSRPPPVRIEQIMADRTRYEPSPSTGRVQFPALIRELQIDYAALSYVMPEKNRFRYKLEGFDRDWQDAGNRRQAFYTNLPPRSYRFRVIASNNSGIWNETGATLDLVIPPAYYQTRWFVALSVGLLLALVWTAHRIRLRIVETHEHEISALNERMMKAQEQERIRIAGELHDGVMQQMLAVTMMLGTTKRKAAGNAEIQASIEKIQQKLIQAGTDIRQLSHGLHPPVLQDEGLPGALRAYCEQFGSASGIPVVCEAEESARELSRGAALALFRITQEALGNAAKHGLAKHIDVRLARTAGSLALTVSDDGVGFDRSRLSTSGGLGLVMMRERAGQLNGTFEFQSASGRGTTIRVIIPFR